VTDDEVKVLLEAHWGLQVIGEQDILGESWKFVQDGVTGLDERVYKMARV